ncbi:hypothetical protein [Methylorubrum podarium]|uniref:hypothetical protein n=1 Tax=Methylorubrum podarium TaxID=200476 RepID=UPI001EE23B2C|nr:hypothetical protein [Methylorubrum podarium]
MLASIRNQRNLSCRHAVSYDLIAPTQEVSREDCGCADACRECRDAQLGVVRLATDDTGVHGWGEAILKWKTRAGVGAIEDLTPLILGRDPRDLEQAVRVMKKQYFWRLLGGRVRDKVGPAPTSLRRTASPSFQAASLTQSPNTACSA